MGTISIYAVKYAESDIAAKLVFAGDNSERKIPISFTVFLIETTERMVLIDAGCEYMDGWDMRCMLPPDEVLRRGGIQPDSITEIVLTHRHHDHVQAVKKFPRATVYMQKDEYAALTGEYIPPGTDVRLFDEKCDICDGIRAIKIGGHSEGSCIVTVDTGVGKYVITGDEVYSPICLENKIPTGSSCNPEKSENFIRKYSRSEYTPLVSHDPNFLPGHNGIVKIV